ncbi:uncharacterized protein C8Q71DRAFT_189605 [Rhodofomes roseus]|uniref:Microbial-type PARG catalytic domain-containing protein n=1 Tax=Rhodofomes roseus TaxID=34475 RepID=A0ABQ8K8L0_9APHY|nr:uncharacterized protein C8Q71DRAFT_189605 [Rhodofomes roseus]KAH9833569.1 hypothetical protein C8Q71DRAFT_189605 [Rhodofomes roseus]
MSIQKFFSKAAKPEDRRGRLRKIAEETLDAIEEGTYTLNGKKHDLRTSVALAKKKTQYYAPDSLLSGWSAARSSRPERSADTDLSVLEVSTLEGARLLSAVQQAGQTGAPPSRVGILNFASATKPGGGFKNGAQAQEESIARSSTLYPTLTTSLSQTFYSVHEKDRKDGFYTHAMIYSPGVIVFRDDDGGWIEPLDVDVLTSAAVNAGVVRQRLHDRLDDAAVEGKVETVMRERMARILYLFEKQGVKSLVLGSFGTGVFRNNVNLVANVWADLLVEPGARFKSTFDHVVFAILGKATFEEFERVLEQRKPASAST